MCSIVDGELVLCDYHKMVKEAWEEVLASARADYETAVKIGNL